MAQVAPDAVLEYAQFPGFSAPSWPAIAARLAGGTAVAAPERTPETPLSYSTRKPYAVVERLDELCGPTAGTVTLPPHLDWSGNATYDLGKPARLASMYRVVLNEAGCADDLQAWLHDRLLTTLWPALWLPAALRRVWEDRFPELTALRA